MVLYTATPWRILRWKMLSRFRSRRLSKPIQYSELFLVVLLSDFTFVSGTDRNSLIFDRLDYYRAWDVETSFAVEIPIFAL